MLAIQQGIWNFKMLCDDIPLILFVYHHCECQFDDHDNVIDLVFIFAAVLPQIRCRQAIQDIQRCASWMVAHHEVCFLCDLEALCSQIDSPPGGTVCTLGDSFT